MVGMSGRASDRSADVTAMAREAGFRWPVAVTAAVWADCVATSESDMWLIVPPQGAYWTSSAVREYPDRS